MSFLDVGAGWQLALWPVPSTVFQLQYRRGGSAWTPDELEERVRSVPLILVEGSPKKRENREGLPLERLQCVMYFLYGMMKHWQLVGHKHRRQRVRHVVFVVQVCRKRPTSLCAFFFFLRCFLFKE